MNIERLLATVLRLLGIYLLVKAVLDIGVLLYANSDLAEHLADSGQVHLWLSFIWFGLTFLISILMIACPLLLARWIVPGQPADKDTAQLSPQGLEVSAFVITGVVLVAHAAMSVFHNGIWLYYQNTDQVSERLSFGSREEFLIGLITALVELGIGLYLVLGARGLQRFISNIRRAGVS